MRSFTISLILLCWILLIRGVDAFWWDVVLGFFCSIPFFGSLFPFCNRNIDDDKSVTETINSDTGTTVDLEDTIIMDIPPGTFDMETTVSIETIQNQDIAIGQDIAIYEPQITLPYQIQITVSQPPQTDTIRTRITIPSDLTSDLSMNDSIQAFMPFQQTSSTENTFTLYELIEGCTINELQDVLTCNLPSYAFTPTSSSSVAIVTLATTPGIAGTNGRKLDSNLLNNNNRKRDMAECLGQSLQCPLSIGCTVVDPFQAETFHVATTGGSLSHLAVDYVAPQETPVLAAADGIVDYVDETRNLGGTVIVRHEQGATRYCHLSLFNVNVGVTVQAGDRIGLSGGTPGSPMYGNNSRGPHLHFEYIPNETTSRIDPDACIANPPSLEPSAMPSITPSVRPSLVPTVSPSTLPSSTPTNTPNSAQIVRVENFYVAFEAPSASRVPTSIEYDEMTTRLKDWFQQNFESVFGGANPLIQFIMVETLVLDSTLFNASIPENRYNIYMEFQYIDVSFDENSELLPTDVDIYSVMQISMESPSETEFIVEKVNTYTNTPFESTVDVVLDKSQPTIVRVESFYMAFVAPSASREPTSIEYDEMANRLLVWFRRSFATEFPTGYLSAGPMVINTTLFNAGIPQSQYNIYMGYQYIDVAFSRDSQTIPSTTELFQYMQSSITADFILDSVRTYINTPFESTNEVFFDLSPQIVRVENFYMAFVAPSASREPTSIEYDGMASRLKDWFQQSFKTEFAENSSTEFVWASPIVIDSTLFNANIPQSRFNIYMDFQYIDVAFGKDSAIIPSATELFQLMQSSITADFIFNSVRSYVNTTFESTTEVFLASSLLRTIVD